MFGGNFNFALFAIKTQTTKIKENEILFWI